MPSTTTARLFFAFWPSAPMQSALADAVASIVREANGRPVPPANFHLTLAFLGSVPVSRLEALHLAATECAQSFSASELPIPIELDRIAHWREPEILCAASRNTPPTAVELAQALKRSLTAHGFAPDLKPFRVHATLARKVHRVTRELRIDPVAWRFDAFHLVESRTLPTGSVYSPLEKWVLDKRDR